METSFKIPTEFESVPFYKKDDRIVKQHYDAYFYYDIAHILEWDEQKPWNDKKDFIPNIFAQWKRVNEQLVEIYRQRNRKQARPIMVSALANFIDAMFWTNGVPVNTLANIASASSSFHFKPINIEERLSFILLEPDHFHAYNQLKSLYEEMEKIYYKSMVGNY